jgi:transcriptional regulator with XRE-family HTH domain
LSQRQLCEGIITRNMLSQIEHGTANPSMDTLKQLAARLGKPVSFFLEETAVLSPNQAIMARARELYDAGEYSRAASTLEGYRAPDEVYDRERELLGTLLCLHLAEASLNQGKRVLAQELLARMTDGRYRKLTLDEELALQTGAEDEDTLRPVLWRSDGTVDQLYLSLRLAAAEALMPEAPLILDDALVRFDDVRMRSAVEILKSLSEEKQVILFTCQGREAAMLD